MKRFQLLGALCGVLMGQSLFAQSIANLPNGAAGPTGSAGPGISRPADFQPPATFNYQRTWSPIFPTTSTAVPSLANYYTMSTTYYDGLGRPVQHLQHKTKKDIVHVVDNRVMEEKLEYLSYPANSSNAGFQTTPYSSQYNFYQSTYPAEGDNAYSRTQGVTVNGQHLAKTFLPGKSYNGSDRGTVSSVEVNSSAVLKLGLDQFSGSKFPVSSGNYASGELQGTRVEGAHGALSREYKNRNGRTICKMVEAGSGTSTRSLWTYYVYDELGRICWVITPRAYEVLDSIGWPAPASPSVQDIYHGLCYGYVYDRQGDVIEKWVPGSGLFQTVLDSKRRPVLTRSPAMAAKGKWEFSVYDNRDRVVFTGTVDDAQSRDIWQSILDNGNAAAGSLAFFLMDDFTGAYPSAIPGVQINSYNYYDSYTFDPTFPYSRSFSTSYSNRYGTANTNVTPVPFNLVNGELTASRIRVMDAGGNVLNEWISSVYFYDQKGRLIQTQTLNPHCRNNWDVTTTQYNFDQTVHCIITDHHNELGGAKPQTIVTLRNTYGGEAGVLQSTKLQIDNNAEVQIASYTYDDLGRLALKNIGAGVEKQAFRYNIRGEITGINPDYVSNPTYPDATFGCILSYDYGFDKPRYDGAIAGMMWRGAGSYARPRAYGYDYDKAGRMLSADFNEQGGGPVTTGIWSKTDHDYSVSGLSYDANGNILKMNQRGTGVSGPMDMDNLSYHYRPNSNVLDRVEDPNPDYGLNDFVNRNAGTSDYTYDEDGNLKSDLNKGITSIEYNFQDLPVNVSTASNGSVKSIYDANGVLVEKMITLPGGLTEVYHYWGGFIYKDKELQMVLHPEGRARFDKPGSDFQYDFFIKDHLGNVRSIVNYQASSIKDYLATHELSSANTESMIFDGVAKRGPKPGGATGDLMAIDLNGSDPHKQTGTSLFLKVMAGDKFKAEVSAYYAASDAMGNEYASGDAMMNSLISGLSGGFSELGNESGGTALIDHMFSPDNYLNVYSGIKDNATDPGKPRAYLNYILFDEDMNIVPGQSGALQVGAANEGQWADLEMSGDITAGQNGYLVVYMSNETYTDVYMDNFLVTYSRGKLLEEQHYYPHGLMVQDGKNNPLVNRYLYQGKELQKEAGMELYDFHARQYDPQIGRFWGIDPADQFPSGYTGMGNDPANQIDPDGMQARPGGGYNTNSAVQDRSNPFSNTNPTTDAMQYELFIARVKYQAYIDNLQANNQNNGANTPTTGTQAPATTPAPGSGTAQPTNFGTGYFEDSYANRFGCYFRPDGTPDWEKMFAMSEVVCRTKSKETEKAEIEERYKYLPVPGTKEMVRAGIQGVAATDIPVVGQIADVTDGIWSLTEGDYTGAGISFAATVVVGGSQLKLARRAFTGRQIHHIIPNQAFKRFEKQLTDMGWFQNHALNLKTLPTPFHANHPAYNKYVIDQMTTLEKNGMLDMPNMIQLQHQMRQEIITHYLDPFQTHIRLNAYYK